MNNSPEKSDSQSKKNSCEAALHESSLRNKRLTPELPIDDKLISSPTVKLQRILVRDSPSVFVGVDNDAMSSTGTTDSSDNYLNLHDAAKCHVRPRSETGDDFITDGDTMMSNVSSISTNTMNKVDELQITEDTRDGFEESLEGQRLFSNMDRDENESNLSSQSSNSKMSDKLSGTTTCIHNMYGTDKASWMDEHIQSERTHGMKSNLRMRSPSPAHSSNNRSRHSSGRSLSPIFEKAVDLTTGSRNVQQNTDAVDQSIPSNSSLDLSTNGTESQDCYEESLDLSCSTQSKIPTVVGCNTSQSHNVTSHGDGKTPENHKLENSAFDLYRQDKVHKSQSGVHQEKLISVQNGTIEPEDRSILSDLNNNNAERSLLTETWAEQSSVGQTSNNFKENGGETCPEAYNQQNELSSNSDLYVYKQYYDTPQNLTTPPKGKSFVQYTHHTDPQVHQYQTTQVFQQNEFGNQQNLIQYASQAQPNHQEIHNSQHLEQTYSQQVQPYTRQDGNFVHLQDVQTREDGNIQMSNYTCIPYSQYEPAIDEQQLAAEQLATELVQNYGGSKSHMISDILKHNDGQSYIPSGYERSSDVGEFNEIPNNQTVIHEVDLLNTPQQLTPLNDYKPDDQSQLGEPQAMSTPDLYRKSFMPKGVHQFEGTATYNDVHLHGGRWKKSTLVDDIQSHDNTESPFPPGTILNRGKSALLVKDEDCSFYSEDSESSCNQSKTEETGRRPFMDIKQQPSYSRLDQGGAYPGFGNSSTGRQYQSFAKNNQYVQPQNESTTMTFTPREMMESHLSQNQQFSKKNYVGPIMSDMDYSSIYPSREFIDRTANEPLAINENKRKHSNDNTPRKRSRVSKYNTEDIPKVPPQMPIVDHMFQKYPPVLRRDENNFAGKHKYFVVNPSDITNMSPKTLLTKYIDFLIVENEQITEISKSTNPPVDIYVTEDMYFMDSLKFHVPFPSRKFVEWVANFYPRLNFNNMKFKGRRPELPKDGGRVQVDNRPTQQILEDTFYFFQGIAMNGQDDTEKIK
ncbi:hypothetical protein ACF0H5_019834 [Mactra antiquata]